MHRKLNTLFLVTCKKPIKAINRVKIYDLQTHALRTINLFRNYDTKAHAFKRGVINRRCF